eukprot:6205625-Pleurochrysis_carterae.AAC.1
MYSAICCNPYELHIVIEEIHRINVLYKGNFKLFEAQCCISWCRSVLGPPGFAFRVFAKCLVQLKAQKYMANYTKTSKVHNLLLEAT